MKISPTSGPVGTPIKVTVVGMGSPTYESVGAFSTTTSSLARFREHDPRRLGFTIRAAGGVGTHWI